MTDQRRKKIISQQRCFWVRMKKKIKCSPKSTKVHKKDEVFYALKVNKYFDAGGVKGIIIVLRLLLLELFARRALLRD